MDRIFELYDFEDDGEVSVCKDFGLAYQSVAHGLRIKYAGSYWQALLKRKGTPVAQRIMASRMSLLSRHLNRNDRILEVGVGCGEFLESVPYDSRGYDINPVGVEWLTKCGKFHDIERDPEYRQFKGWCFWDVLEHMEVPELIFRRIVEGSTVFCSVPIIRDMDKIKESKHYKPGEHLYYWTLKAFIDWMYDWGFSLLEIEAGEMYAGREQVYSFAFKKNMPDYMGLITEYHAIHEREPYGETSAEFVPEILRSIAKGRYKTILDYGCGRSVLAAYLYGDGSRKVLRYDPAIPEYKQMPSQSIDMVICTDVLEHIWKRDLTRIFEEIKSKASSVFFTVSTIPARKKLSNGLNAHVTVMPEKWWMRLIEKHFGACTKIGNYGAGFICKTF